MKPFKKWMVIGPDGTALSTSSHPLAAMATRRKHQQRDFVALFDSADAAADALSNDSHATYNERIKAGWRIVEVRVSEVPLLAWLDEEPTA